MPIHERSFNAPVCGFNRWDDENMNRETIRLLIVDSDSRWRQQVIASLNSCARIAVIGEASNGRAALAQAKQQRPDVVLTDCILPDMHGEHLTRVLRRQRPKIKVVVLASVVSMGLIRLMLDAGAISYLLKNTAPEDISRAVQEAYEGISTLAPEAAASLVQSTQQTDLSYLRLTGREREVLSLMVNGLTNADIAESLAISVLTVKKHIRNLSSKLKAHSRQEAIVLTMERNLLADWFTQNDP